MLVSLHLSIVRQFCVALILLASPPAGSTYCGEVARSSFRARSPVSAFYYASYGTPGDSAGDWAGWNSLVQAHWNERVNTKNRWKNLIGTRYEPPEEIGSRFYPVGGPYSSEDHSTMRRQFKQMKDAGTIVVVFFVNGALICVLIYLLIMYQASPQPYIHGMEDIRCACCVDPELFHVSVLLLLFCSAERPTK